MPVKPVKLSLDSGDMAIPPIYVTNCGLLLKKTEQNECSSHLRQSIILPNVYLQRGKPVYRS